MAKASNKRSILGREIHKFERDKGKVQRVPFGRGEDPNAMGVGDAIGLAEKCIRCSFGNIPVIEEVVWTIPLPLTADEALATLGDTVNLLSGSSSVPGVVSMPSEDSSSMQQRASPSSASTRNESSWRDSSAVTAWRCVRRPASKSPIRHCHAPISICDRVRSRQSLPGD